MQYSLRLAIVGLVALVISLELGWRLWQRTPTPVTSPLPTKLRVLTTFFPLYDFTRNIGQDTIDLDILFTQTPEVASFRPEDIQKINQADMVIKNGAGLEPVLDDLIASSDNKHLMVLDTSLGIPLLEEADEEEAGNPHIWLDPQRALIQVQHIRNALMKADPSNAAAYQEQADGYIEQLQQLDRELAARLTTLPGKDFVAFHSAFAYFAKRYGLRQAAVIEEFPGKEPSPAYLAQVIETIKNSGIKAIFAEPQFSPKMVETIARDLGLEVHVLNPIETGTPGQDSYLSLMRANTQTLVEALQ